MKDFLDRHPTKAGRRKITYEDGRSEFVTVEMADEPTVDGTPLNREAYMYLQGFGFNHTAFNADGSITETNDLGESVVTNFSEDGSITEVFTNANGLKIGKKTTFDADGGITEELIEFETEV